MTLFVPSVGNAKYEKLIEYGMRRMMIYNKHSLFSFVKKLFRYSVK